jgi:hypothetical protein
MTAEAGGHRAVAPSRDGSSARTIAGLRMPAPLYRRRDCPIQGGREGTLSRRHPVGRTTIWLTSTSSGAAMA